MSLYPEFDPKLINTIKNSTLVVVASHQKPDGDCVYSALALKLILQSLGKTVILLNEGPFSKPEIKNQEHNFVKEVNKQSILNKQNNKNELNDQNQQNNKNQLNEQNNQNKLHPTLPLIITVDCGSLNRVGNSLDKDLVTEDNLINLDHHGSTVHIDASSYIIPDSICTTLIVYHLAKALDVKLNKEMASFILRGFLTDSGCFRYLSPHQNESLALISKIITDFDLCISYECEYLFSRSELGSNDLLCTLIKRTQSFLDEQVVLTFINKDEGFDYPTDDYYSQMLKVSKVKVVILLQECPTHTEFSLRSSHRSKFNVGQFAKDLPQILNGGGHFHSGGGKLPLTLNQSKDLILKELLPIL